jgi:hypothetical protein
MHRMNIIKFMDAAGCQYMLVLAQSCIIPLQLSTHPVYTNVNSDNCMTEPVERSPRTLGTAVLEAFPSCLLLYSHIVPSGLCQPTKSVAISKAYLCQHPGEENSHKTGDGNVGTCHGLRGMWRGLKHWHPLLGLRL